VKVLRYEIKDLTPPKEILHAMQAQITAEREKRALIAASEGRKQEQINIATGEREASIAKSKVRSRRRSIVPKAGSGDPLDRPSSAEAIRKTAAAIREPGGSDAVNLKSRSNTWQRLGNWPRQQLNHRAGQSGRYQRLDRNRVAGGEVANEVVK